MLKGLAPWLISVVALVFTLVNESGVAGEIRFPELSGRVVDEAGLLSPAARQLLTEKLTAHENATSNQIVVVTLKDIDGRNIQDYGYQLGRHWGIGQKGKNNGALLIVAQKERKVRIEVGYGLEGVLTDARSKRIINQSIIPYFKQNKPEQGIVQGVAEMISVIEKGAVSDATTATKKDETNMPSWFAWALLLGVPSFLISLVLWETKGGITGGSASPARSFNREHYWKNSKTASTRRSRRTGGVFDPVTIPTRSYGSSFGSSSNDSGGGFSGGGGDFGGGGADGGW